ncbi:MAG: mandelate racemase/muconate lactonizing enzyme family protein [Desulfobacteraceae bacterium]|nr:mandelate racemase/muconate lactonizing enzyme family protein [Desulfobacteraceae bacterium]
MKIGKIKTVALSVPLERPFTGQRQQPRERINPVIVQLTTDEGLEAFGLAFAWNDRQVKSLKASIEDLEYIIIGQDVFHWAEAWQRLYNATRHMGHHGYGIYALAAIDTALWVLRAKALGRPLAHLLGGFRQRVPAYASHLLFRNWSLDELQRDAAALVEQGFKVVKMNMGDKPFKVELERLKAVRQAVGDDIGIMIDVNWAWSVTDTIKMGREIEKYNVYWLEDPLASEDPAQLAQVADALDVPIADGETFCTKYEFRRLIEKGAADILIVDLQRVGGISEWMKVATMAEAWNLPIASHLFHDFSVHLVAAIPNGLILEYMPWYDQIYQEPPQVKDGYMDVPDTPGLGLELDPEAIKKYELR